MASWGTGENEALPFLDGNQHMTSDYISDRHPAALQVQRTNSYSK
jgi:hypothetical protein